MSRLLISNPVYLTGITLDDFKARMCDRCNVLDKGYNEEELEIVCEGCPLNRLTSLDDVMKKGKKNEA